MKIKQLILDIIASRNGTLSYGNLVDIITGTLVSEIHTVLNGLWRNKVIVVDGVKSPGSWTYKSNNVITRVVTDALCIWCKSRVLADGHLHRIVDNFQFAVCELHKHEFMNMQPGAFKWVPLPDSEMQYSDGDYRKLVGHMMQWQLGIEQAATDCDIPKQHIDGWLKRLRAVGFTYDPDESGGRLRWAAGNQGSDIEFAAEGSEIHMRVDHGHSRRNYTISLHTHPTLARLAGMTGRVFLPIPITAYVPEPRTCPNDSDNK